jgi:hypothetical protein
MLKCPTHELPSNTVINNLYARLTLHDKDLLHASSLDHLHAGKKKLSGIFLIVFKKILKDGKTTKVGSQV